MADVERPGGATSSRFHAEVTRAGAEWLIDVKELNLRTVAQHAREIVPRTHDLIAAHHGLAHDQIDLVVLSERDGVRDRATQLGFETTANSLTRTDTYQLPEKPRSVTVRYDDHGAVVGIDATTQIAEFHATRDSAYDALFFTAQYSDIRRRRLDRQ